jgi:hypothetical protein
LNETLTLLKSTIAKHPGIQLDIETARAAISLDTDIEGFDTTVVSYFTVDPQQLTI